LEPSPLNRVLGQRNPGGAWNTHPTGIAYLANSGQIAYFNVENNILKRNGVYAPYNLFVTRVNDEDGKISTEYKNKFGQVVMKQNSTNVNTYYVYNDLGQLAYVLPPLASDGMGANTTYSDNHDMLLKYGYVYKYDEHGNNVVKRLPGCDSICMVYDKANRLICSQDGNQRLKNKWAVNKYDQLGRVIYTGIMTNTKKRVELKALISTLVITESFDVSNTTFYNTGYSCLAAPAVLTGIIPLTVNYYDNYFFINFQSSESDKSNLGFFGLDGFDNKYPISKGLLTGTRTYILDKTINSYMTTALYYDDRGRVVQTRATNHLGGYDYVYNHYDFTGKVITTRKEHTTNIQPLIYEIYANTYDKAGRLSNTDYYYNSPTSFPFTSITYDELGRMNSKHRHNNSDLEQYNYNIRNWTTKIKSGAFEENLYYNNCPDGGGYYNGNIGYQTWTYKGTTNHYIYAYDELNRLSDASNEDLDAHTDHGETLIEYDKQGNMTTVTRYLGTPDALDMLNLTYSGNQLKKVKDWDQCQSFYSLKDYVDGVDVDTEFNYDKNGNMTTDLDRNIASIRYNMLNLPDTIQFFGGNQIINRYAADGRKLGTEYFTRITGLAAPITAGQVISQSYLPGAVNQNGTAYVDNKEYNTLNGNWSLSALSRVYNPEGYASYNTSPYGGFIYTRKDHLGSIREVWHAASNTTIQRTQYYPSGLAWETTPDDNLSTQPYKYNGKEFVEMHGYNGLDYGARTYFSDRSGWGSMDPLAEKYYSISPYAYCAGNPVRFIDPNGMDIDDYFNYAGDYLGSDEATTDNVKITSQQSWDAAKTVNSDGTESIDHATGSVLSLDNSVANLSTDAELSVYDHYNSTGQTLNAASNENGNGGAAFCYSREKGVITTGIEVYIEGNKSKPHNIADHANEIKNTFVHEGKHVDDYNQLGFDGYRDMPEIYKESRAVQTQMNDATFPLTRPIIQQMNMDYGVSKGLVLPIKISIKGI